MKIPMLILVTIHTIVMVVVGVENVRSARDTRQTIERFELYLIKSFLNPDRINMTFIRKERPADIAATALIWQKVLSCIYDEISNVESIKKIGEILTNRIKKDEKNLNIYEIIDTSDFQIIKRAYQITDEETGEITIREQILEKEYRCLKEFMSTLQNKWGYFFLKRDIQKLLDGKSF